MSNEPKTPDEDCSESSQFNKETSKMNENTKSGIQNLEVAFSKLANKKILLQRLGMDNE